MRCHDTFLSFLRDNNDKETIKQNINSLKSSDWQRLCDLSLDKGLYPVFYSRLSDSPGIPPEILSKLKNIYLRNLKINIIAYREMLSLIGCLQEKGVPVIPLKGPALALYLYGDLGLRRNSCDLDLLVKRENFKKAKSLLEETGYNADNDKCEFKLERDRQLSFVKKDAGGKRLLLELHFDLRGFFAYPRAEDFWSSVRETDLDGNRVLMPANEDLLIYLSLTCMTITEFIELRYIYDIHTLTGKFGDTLNWGILARRLKNHRHGCCVFFALKLSKELFGVNFPKDFINAIKPGIIKRLILGFWINKNNVLRNWNYASRCWYYFFASWHYFATSYLYSRNIFDCFKITYKKIFPPGTPAHLCLKRLFKPVFRIFYTLHL